MNAKNYYLSRSFGGKRHLFVDADGGFLPICGCPGSNNGSMKKVDHNPIDPTANHINVCVSGTRVLSRVAELAGK